MLPHTNIEQRLQAAVQAVLPDADVSSVLVRPCPDPKFGDYQTNALMSLAKARKMNPRQLATDVLAKLEVADVVREGRDRRRGLSQLPPEACRAGSRPSRPAATGEHLFFEPRRRAAHRGGRFQLAQRRQADARRPHPLHHPGRLRSRASSGCWATRSSPTTTSATGARSSACCSSAGSTCWTLKAPQPIRSPKWSGSTSHQWSM